MPNSSCAWMRPRPSRPLRRLRWVTHPPSRRPKCAMQPWSGRQRWATHPPSGRPSAQCSQCQRGQGVSHKQCLCPATNTQGKYASTATQSDSRRRMGPPSLCGDLWSSLTGLSAQNPWGTDVPSTTPNQQCATSHHFGIAGYHPTISCSGQRTNVGSFHPRVLEMSVPPTGTKWQHCSSNQGASMPRPEEEETAELDVTPK